MLSWSLNWLTNDFNAAAHSFISSFVWKTMNISSASSNISIIEEAARGLPSLRNIITSDRSFALIELLIVLSLFIYMRASSFQIIPFFLKSLTKSIDSGSDL